MFLATLVHHLWHKVDEPIMVTFRKFGLLYMMCKIQEKNLVDQLILYESNGIRMRLR